MAVKERISEQEYQRLALDTPDVQWELHRGELREKPGMSAEHNDVMTELVYQLRGQLDRRHFRVRVNSARTRRTSENYYIPDLLVVPAALEHPQRGQPGTLEIYDAPLPLVVEIWSRSTGVYDIDSKLPEYQARGDKEIWRIHPYDRTLSAWVRQPEGSYARTDYQGGIVRPTTPPNVEIDLVVLFAD